MLESLLSFLRRYRPVSLSVATVMLVAGVWYALQITVSDSPEDWMPRSTIDNWARFAQHFEFGDTVAIAMEFREGVEDRDIDFLKSLRKDLSQVPGVIRVTDISFAIEEIEADVRLTEMLETPAGDHDPFEVYRGVLFDDPRVWNPQDPHTKNRTILMLVEIDATVDGSVQEALARPDVLNERRRVAMGKIHTILDEHRRDDVIFHPAGAVVIQYELEQIARRLFVQLVPPALLLMLVSLGLAFRSPSAILIALLGGAWSIVVMVGAVVMIGWTLNVVTVAGPILMIVITIATTVHIAHHYSTVDPKRLKTVAVTRRARRRFISWVAVPCLGAALTTGFGFLMLTFNELQPLRELGVELFVGSILAFFGCYAAWLIIPPLRVRPGRILSTDRMSRLAEKTTRRPTTTVLLAVPFLAAMIYATTLVNVAVDPFSFFREDSYVAKGIEHYASRQFGHYTLDVVLVPKHLPNDPVIRERARQEHRRIALEFQRRIEGRVEVRRVVSETMLQRHVAEMGASRDRALAQAQTGGQWLSIWWTHGKRMAALQSLFHNWLVDHSGEEAIRITFLTDDRGTGFRPLLEDVREQLGDVAEDDFDYFLTGTSASVVVLSEQLVGAMLQGLIAAMITMAIVCGVLFRSVRLTVIAVLPNVFPILTVFTVMAIFQIPLNSGSAMVASIALGVGLNDTVHFVLHYRGHRLGGEDCATAVHETFRAIARPMIITSLVICAGFAIFLLSEFRPMFHFGLLSSVAMAAALAGDLVLLPNLLRVFDRREYHASGSQFWRLLKSRRLYVVVRLAVGCYFLCAAVAKLFTLDQFSKTIVDFGIVYESWSLPLAIAIVAVEVVAGVALLLDVRGALAAIAGLLLVFVGVLAYGLWMGFDIDCGCLGPAASLSLSKALAIDVGLLVSCGLMYWSRWIRSVDAKKGKSK